MGGPEPLVSHLKLFSLEKAGSEFWSRAADGLVSFWTNDSASLMQSNVPWSENLKILKWVGFYCRSPPSTTPAGLALSPMITEFNDADLMQVLKVTRFKTELSKPRGHPGTIY